MTLKQATCAVFAAVEAEDMGALAQALAARDSALCEAPLLNREDWEAGELACRALDHLKHRWAEESARLEQMRSGFGESGSHDKSELVFHG